MREVLVSWLQGSNGIGQVEGAVLGVLNGQDLLIHSMSGLWEREGSRVTPPPQGLWLKIGCQLSINRGTDKQKCGKYLQCNLIQP